MPTEPRGCRTLPRVVVVLLGIMFSGCHQCSKAPSAIEDVPLPRELAKYSLPPYVIEPPDILTIDALRVVPLPPYHTEPQDTLLIRVTGTPAEAPIDGLFIVNSDGTVTLGADYGTVNLDGQTLEQAQATIENQLKKGGLKAPHAIVSLAQSQSVEQIRGEHLVRPDGTISLGVYGSVSVTGLTIEDARAAIENHLLKYLVRPKVAVDVLAYNSKILYVITDGAGYGQTVVRLPVTGNETVLDAISQVNGLSPQASKCHIWVARPAPTKACCQILPVDWNAIVECGRTGTNYQLLPGDRVYVKADRLITADNWIAKIVSPLERILGLTLLGSESVNSIKGQNGGIGGGIGR